MTPEQTIRYQTLIDRTRVILEDLEFIEYSHITMRNGKQYHTVNINRYAKGRIPRSADTIDEMMDMWERFLNDPPAYS